MLDDLDRYPLVLEVTDRRQGWPARPRLRQEMVDQRLRARAWTREYGEDHRDVRDWVWPH